MQTTHSIASLPSVTQSIGSAVSLEELQLSDVKTHMKQTKLFLLDFKDLIEQCNQMNEKWGMFMGSFNNVIDTLPVHEYEESFEIFKASIEDVIRAQSQASQVMSTLYILSLIHI